MKQESDVANSLFGLRTLRRGQPDEIFGDNGTIFVGAERVLRESLQSLQQSKLNNFCLQLEIKWRFNPPYANHMGGAWERMIRSVHNSASEFLVTLSTFATRKSIHKLLCCSFVGHSCHMASQYNCNCSVRSSSGSMLKD